MKDLLIVEDDDSVREAVVLAVRAAGYEVKAVATAAEGKRMLEEDSYHMVLIDFMLPDGSGADLIKLAAARQPDSRRVLMSGKNFDAGAVENCDRWLVKPVKIEEILAEIERGKHWRDAADGDGPVQAFDDRRLPRR